MPFSICWSEDGHTIQRTIKGLLLPIGRNPHCSKIQSPKWFDCCYILLYLTKLVAVQSIVAIVLLNQSGFVPRS